MYAFEAVFESWPTPCSPTDAIILAIIAPSIDDSYKINQELTVTQTLGHFVEVRIFVADHDGLSVIQHCVDVVDHKFGYVRNMVEDEVPVRANQTGNIHVSVVDAQVISLSQQAFDDFDQGAFSQIVGSRFEAEAQNTDACV